MGPQYFRDFLMKRLPKIPNLEDETDDFHDSHLIDLIFNPSLDELDIVLSTPDEHLRQQLWQLSFHGLLRFEFEHIGDGADAPRSHTVGIHSVYNDKKSEERERWVERLVTLGVPPQDAASVKHIVMANSTIGGWGERQHLQGINIICRDVTIAKAPPRYIDTEIWRPPDELE
jgi:hypothetical protein